jgi:hypothetical protein
MLGIRTEIKDLKGLSVELDLFSISSLNLREFQMPINENEEHATLPT